MTHYVLLRVDFYSPYTSVQIFAEHGKGPPVPPPSTLIGALAAVLYHPTEREVGEDVVEAVDYATFYVPHYQSVENISRHFTWLSQRRQRGKAIKIATELVEKKVSIDKVYKDLSNYAGIRSKLEELERYGPIDIARMATQVLLSPATRLETYFADSGYILYAVSDAKVAEGARYVYRLGPKEAIVAVTPVDVKVQRLRAGVVNTRFYFPRDAGRNVLNCVEVYMFDRPVNDPLSLTPRKYCIPDPIEDIQVEPADGWAPIRIVAEGLELTAVVPEYAAP